MATRKLTAKIQVRRDTSANWKSKKTILGDGEIGYDTTHKITKIGDGITAWMDLDYFVMQPTPPYLKAEWATASWSEISEIIKNDVAALSFDIGDEKKISLTTGEQITLVILGFNHDELQSGGKASMSIGMKNSLSTTYQMNSTNTSSGGWEKCLMRTEVMPTLLNRLPSDLRSIIKPVIKLSSSKNTTDNLWLFSKSEIAGETANDPTQYDYWKNTAENGRIKLLSDSGTAHAWWLRDATNFTDFYYVLPRGTFFYGGAQYASGVSFGFCI